MGERLVKLFKNINSGAADMAKQLKLLGDFLDDII